MGFREVTNIVASWKTSPGHAQPFIAPPPPATRQSPGETCSRNDTNVQSERIDFLISHIETTQNQLDSFYKTVYSQMPFLKTDLKSSEHGLQTLSVVQKGIKEMAVDNHFMSKKLQSLGSSIERFALESSPYIPEVTDSSTRYPSHVAPWFIDILEVIEKLSHARDDTVRENHLLHKSILAKDKKLAQEQTESLRSRDLRGAREDKLSKENLALDSELQATKQKLEKVLKQPDLMRAEFSGKTQKLYDKVRDLEKKLKDERQNHDILKLDNEASVKDLDGCRVKIEKFKEGREQFKAEYAKLKGERDHLLTLQKAQTPDRQAELQCLRKIAREAKLREESWTEEKTRLEADLNNLAREREIDENTVGSLS
jgi:hypothetical protein